MEETEVLSTLDEIINNIIEKTNKYVYYYYIILRYGSYELKIKPGVINEIEQFTGQTITDIHVDKALPKIVSNKESSYYSRYLPKVKKYLKQIVKEKYCADFKNLALNNITFALHDGMDETIKSDELFISITQRLTEINTNISKEQINKRIEDLIGDRIYAVIDKLGTETGLDNISSTLHT